MTSQNEYRAGFGARVTQTARLWRRAVDHRLQPFGLTEATWLPLLRLPPAGVPPRPKNPPGSTPPRAAAVRRPDQPPGGGLRPQGESDLAYAARPCDCAEGRNSCPEGAR